MRKKMTKQAFHLEEANRTKSDICDEHQNGRSTTSTSSGFSTGSRPCAESKG
jgi:hypothetical protein